MTDEDANALLEIINSSYGPLSLIIWLELAKIGMEAG